MLRIEFSSLAIHLTVKKIQDDVLIQEEMGDDRTELQRKIIREHKKDSSKTDREIADKLNCSKSYVNQVRNEYDDSGGGKWIIILLILGFLAFLAMSESGSGMIL